MKEGGMIEMDIDPVAKPRMTISDKWRKRPVVERYFRFKDAIRLLCKKGKFSLPDRYEIVFYIKVPDSWNSWKKKDSIGKPHQQKPDLDNLIKSVNDCLKVEDKTVWHVNAWKFWGERGRIIIKSL